MKNTIFFQMVTLKGENVTTDKHHFVQAETPEQGIEKVKEHYKQHEEVKEVVLRSSSKATLQDPRSYKMLIQ